MSKEVDKIKIVYGKQGTSLKAYCVKCGVLVHYARGCNRGGLAYAASAAKDSWKRHNQKGCKRKMNKVHFSSMAPHYATPKDLYQELHKEFGFEFDPCPLHSSFDGLSLAWASVNFVNPPYGRKIGQWLRKGFEEWKLGKTVVFLIPSRTDTKWWHDYCMKASEIRFIKGRLKFKGAKNNAPFPSAIVIFEAGATA